MQINMTLFASLNSALNIPRIKSFISLMTFPIDNSSSLWRLGNLWFTPVVYWIFKLHSINKAVVIRCGHFNGIFRFFTSCKGKKDEILFELKYWLIKMPQNSLLCLFGYWEGCISAEIGTWTFFSIDKLEVSSRDFLFKWIFTLILKLWYIWKPS